MRNSRARHRLWSPFLSIAARTAKPEVYPKQAKPAPDLEKYKDDPVLFAQDKLGFTPDEQQRAVLTAQNKRIIICASRQWGKSTVTAAKAIHHAWFHPNTLVLVLSPSERQSAEFIRKMEGFARSLGVKIKGDGDNPCSLLLPNGTRIVGLPGSEATNRGFSAPSLVLIDEAARVDDGLYFAIRPMLAVSQGQIILMSTPFGQRGFFYEEWSKQPSDWLKISVPANQCKRIPAHFLAEELNRLSTRFFQQEYMCQFQANEDALFDPKQVWAILDPTIPPLY